MSYDTIYGSFHGPSFADTYPSVEEFIKDYTMDVALPQTITTENATTLYYLLYAYYGNSIIASSDLNRFRYNLFSLIWQYGPTWEKRLEIQKKLRELSDEEIFTGAKQIANHAYNPSTTPTTASLSELEFIDQQNTMAWKRSKLEGYSQLMALLDTDVTAEFLARFRKLFIVILEPQKPLFYGEEEDE